MYKLELNLQLVKQTKKKLFEGLLTSRVSRFFLSSFLSFSRLLFPLSGDVSKQIYCHVFLCIIGTEDGHMGIQRLDKSTQICYGLMYPHSHSGINGSITVKSSAQIGLETID